MQPGSRGGSGTSQPAPVSGEFYLPALVELARRGSRPVVSLVVEDDGTLSGINDRAQLAEGRVRASDGHQRRPHDVRVTMVDPSSGVHRRFGRAGGRRDDRAERDPARHPLASAPGRASGPAASIIDTVVGRNASSGPAFLESSEWRTRSRFGPSRTSGPKSSIGAKATLGHFASGQGQPPEPGVPAALTSCYIGDARSWRATTSGAGNDHVPTTTRPKAQD